MVTMNSRNLLKLVRLVLTRHIPRGLLVVVLALSLVLAALGSSPTQVAQAAYGFTHYPCCTFLVAAGEMVENASAASGDYNGDGLLDVVVAGFTSAGAPKTALYRYRGSNDFETDSLSSANLPNVGYAALAWGDFDRDNDIDLLITGRTALVGGTTVVKLLQNEPGGVLVDSGAIFPEIVQQGLYWGSAAWADYDLDGDLDLLLTGATVDLATRAFLLRNDGYNEQSDAYVFSDSGIGLQGMYKSTANWVDYNLDGYPDIFMTGDSIQAGVIARLYRNIGTGFADQAIAIPGVMLGSSAWGDYDADGDPDLLLAGMLGTLQPITRVYRNDHPGGFSLAADLPGVSRATVAWGDFDNNAVPLENDGRLDALVGGAAAGSYEPVTTLYRYNPTADPSSAFTPSGIVLSGLARGTMVVGDLEGDRDLDMVGFGRGPGFTPDANFYRNNANPGANLPPQPPVLNEAVTALNPSTMQYRVDLSWTAASDDHTPTLGLGYNAFVRDETGSLVVSPMASLSTGVRRLAGGGNTGSNPFSGLILPHESACPVYEWSAQSIDTAGGVSPFAAAGQFIVNSAPQAADDYVSMFAGQTIDINVVGNDGDADGDLLTLVSIGEPEPGDAGVEFSIVNNRLHVVAPAFIPNHSLQVRIDYLTADPCALRGLDFENALASSGTVFLEVTADNIPPVAIDDYVVTDEDTSVTIDILANDVDDNNDPLTVIEVTQPGFGAVLLNENGTVTYTPFVNAFGDDSFTYTIEDGFGGSDSASVFVTVTPVNDGPVFPGEPPYVYTLTINEDDLLTTSAVASDVEDDPLVYSQEPGAGPSHGILEIDAVTGMFTYIPDLDYFGGDSFMIRVSEDIPGGLFATARFNLNILPVNDAPVAESQYLEINEDTSLAGQDLTYYDFDLDPLTFLLTVDVQHGVLTVNPNNRTFDYIPAPDFNGSDEFSYRVNDGVLESSEAGVIIIVLPVNDAPVAVDDNGIEINENTPPTMIDVLANDYDPDGTTPTVQSITQGAHGVVTLTGGQVFYQPAPDFNGSDTFNYTITDGELTASARVQITVLNTSDAPVLADIPNQTVTENQLLEVTVTATDPSPGETFSFSAAWLVGGSPQPLPTGASIDPTSGVLRWNVPEGAALQSPFQFRVTVTDSENLTDNTTFTVTVTPDIDLRLVVNNTPQPVPAGETLTFTILLFNEDATSKAENVLLTASLPGWFSFLPGSSSSQCEVVGLALGCSLPELQPGKVQVLTVSGTVDAAITESVVFTTVFQAAADQVDRFAANNAASVTSVVSVVIPVYVGGDEPGDEWSDPITDVTPSGRRFMGEFNNQTVTLTLKDLPQHLTATVKFDLFIIRSWDGNQEWSLGNTPQLTKLEQVDGIIGPDLWELNVENGPVLVRSSFTNWQILRQAYPGPYPGGDYPAKTGAIERDTLGYDYIGITEMDSIYHFEITFVHTGDTLVLNFRDLGLQSKEDEAWGLDNIEVSVLAAEMSPRRIFLPVISK